MPNYPKGTRGNIARQRVRKRRFQGNQFIDASRKSFGPSTSDARSASVKKLKSACTEDIRTNSKEICTEMSYGQRSTSLAEYAAEKKALLVDLRSDTVSKPTKNMRLAMFNAEVGDDVYGEDPTVNKLEEKTAELMGKEAAIFVTCGTMGNLIAIMNHCDTRGCEAYCGEDSHVVLHEQGGAAQIGGVTVRALANNPDGTFDLETLESKLRGHNAHETISRLVIVENTMNGKVIPMDWIRRLAKLAKDRGLKLHMDGARVWNASVASNVPVQEIVADFDSVTFCLSKGLGAPVGSVLCGSKEFIAKARRIRKVLGGGMRQAGILAAAGLVALEETIPILKEDHRRAAIIARAINEMQSKSFSVDLNSVQTNMVFVNIHSKSLTGEKFAERLKSVVDDVEDDRIVLICSGLSKKSVRFVLYYGITDELMEAAIRKIKYVIKYFDGLSETVN